MLATDSDTGGTASPRFWEPASPTSPVDVYGPAIHDLLRIPPRPPERIDSGLDKEAPFTLAIGTPNGRLLPTC